MNTQSEALRLAEVMSLTFPGNKGIDMAAAELRRLHAIEDAAKNLVKVKGRYHTEQAFNQLKELLK